MSVFAAVLASSIGNLVHPLFIAFAWLLAEFYSVIPNYAIAIALLTITVMIVVFPITRRGARSMMRMQVLAPDMKVLQAKYKAKPGMATAERQELRQKLNEEMMALYKENGVSPTGGCLPMFLQFPIFWILYATIRGLTHEVVVHGKTVVQPLYISHTTKLYHSITFGHSGKLLPAFGINLSDSVRTAGLSWPQKIPYIVMILVAIALQFVQMKQLSGRNPAAAQANPQMQQMQKVMPLIFAVIYISIPAGVNVYFIVSSMFRIGQQEFMYRRDPQLQASLAKLRERTKSDPKVVSARAVAAGGTGGKGILARFRPAALQAAGEGVGTGTGRPSRTTDGKPPASRSPQRPASKNAPPRAKPSPRTQAASTTNGASAAERKQQPRAQGKRTRRPR